MEIPLLEWDLEEYLDTFKNDKRLITMEREQHTRRYGRRTLIKNANNDLVYIIDALKNLPFAK